MANVQILLTSEKFVKSVTSISDNVAGKYLLSAIREAQDIQLRNILGDALLQKLKDLVGADFNMDFSDDFQTPDKFTGTELNYKDLLRRCQYFLAYTSVVEVLWRVSYKVANFGIVRNTDENMQGASGEEMERTRTFWQAKADSYCLDLQNWLLANRSLFPELSDSQCCKIKSNLTSAATCGIWLGGPRGKMVGGCKR